jgi:hypothetical protein
MARVTDVTGLRINPLRVRARVGDITGEPVTSVTPLFDTGELTMNCTILAPAVGTTPEVTRVTESDRQFVIPLRARVRVGSYEKRVTFGHHYRKSAS